MKSALIALLFYSFIFLIYLFPVFVRLDKNAYVLPSDSLATLGWLNDLSGQNPLRVSPLEQVATYFPLRVLNYFLGSTVSYNIMVLLSLVLSAFFTFLLSRRLKLSYLSAVFSGLVFSFSQYFFWFSTQNIELAAAFWIPIYVFAYLNFLDNHNLKSTLFLGISLTLIFFGSLQLALFALILLIFLPALKFLYGGLSLNFLLKLFLSTTVFLFLSLPVSYPIFGYFFRTSPSSVINEMINRNVQKNTINQVFALSARPWDYFLPSIYHPLFGNYVRHFYEVINPKFSWQFWSTYLPERAIFLGYTAVILSLIPVLGLFLGRFKLLPFEKRTFFIIFILFLFSILISFPPFVSFRGIIFPLSPSFLIYKVLPMFRSYIRMAIFAKFFLSILSAFGLEIILKRVPSKRLKIAIFTAVVVGVLFENITYPPFFYLDLSKIPETYQWLEKKSEDKLITEYPLDSSIDDIGGGCPSWLKPNVYRDYNQSYSIYYQSIHKKNVLDLSLLSSKERAIAWDLSNPEAFNILKNHKVNLVIIHVKDPLIGIHPFPYVQENPLDSCWQRRIMKAPEKVYEGFKKTAEFDDGIIYSLD